MKHSIIDLIGNTPMLELKNTNIYLKVEGFNPTGSIKDRAAKQMILDEKEHWKSLHSLSSCRLGLLISCYRLG